MNQTSTTVNRFNFQMINLIIEPWKYACPGLTEEVNYFVAQVQEDRGGRGYR